MLYNDIDDTDYIIINSYFLRLGGNNFFPR